MTIKQAVMFGAGNVGRGFIGQLFSESGNGVTFVDIDDELIAALASRHNYPIRLVDNDHAETVLVGPVDALHSIRQAAEVAQVLAGAELAATAVGARVLPAVAPLIAKGIGLRIARGSDIPLNIIVCENLKGAAAQLREMVLQHLDPAGQAYLHSHVGFVDTVIGRMVPPPTAAMRAEDPTLIVVEPYKELPVERSGFVGGLPVLVGMEPCDNFPAYTARKLYIHNCGHAVLAYLGYLRGCEYGYDALVDEQVRPMLEAALSESARGIVAAYGVDGGWLAAHSADLLARFANRALGDTIFRLGRDPIRKLAPTDRLIGAARLAEQAGIEPDGLAWAIAAGFYFDPPGDPLAQELQQRIAAYGFGAVLADVCGVQPDELLGQMICARYERLREKRWW